MLIMMILSAIFILMADDQIPPVNFNKHAISMKPECLQLPEASRTVYWFTRQPVNLLDSYWDYQIGGYTTLATRVQSSEVGGGVYISFMGQRTSTGQRRVFFSYIDNNGNPNTTNEITSTQRREGYVSHDVDRLSGKPIYAWHTDSDPTDAELEVDYTWDAYLEHIPGLMGDDIITIDNPIHLTFNNVQYNDNEFIWPLVEIGPSPVQDHRRAYIFATNSVSHSSPANASENVYIAYADFTPTMLEEGTHLTWSYTTVPLLDQWNIDQTAWRRFFHATVVGDDGHVYMIGYHVGEIGEVGISEPYLDVLENSNYGVGEWTQYSINPDITVPNPLNYFTDDNGDPYPFLRYAVMESTNDNAYISSDGHLHYPILYGFTTPDSASYFPLLQYLKDLDFNTSTHAFLLHDLYPAGVHPNDGNPVLPWDLDEDGVVDSDDGATPNLYPTWPFVYWDQNADGGQLLFDYNTIKFTKQNEQGMVACVWSSSLNAKLYNESQADYPELSPYQNVPEIFISLYPVQVNGEDRWSDPIELNSVVTPDLHPANNIIIPEWVYPGDYIEYTGVTDDANHYKKGKLHLMFFDDNTWGSGSITNPIGQNDGGKVMYANIDFAWAPQPYTGIGDPVAPAPKLTLSNYPNPFNPTTTIAFDLVKSGSVKLNIYNIRGQKVKSVLNENMQVGHHTISWNGTSEDGSQVASGVYFSRLENGGKTIINKMVLLK